MAAPARKSIGEALAELTAEFPDADIKESKLRYLESEGLITPARTPAGYRKYSVSDMERLRLIIRLQRDHYLPLKVIREHLAALDSGDDAALPGPTLSAPAANVSAFAALLSAQSAHERLSRRELLKRAHIDEEQLDQLEEFGLVAPRSGTRFYSGEALEIAQVAGQLATYGLEPRHLRLFRTTADREIALIEQVVAPIRQSRQAGAEGRAQQVTEEIMALALQLHSILVRIGLP